MEAEEVGEAGRAFPLPLDELALGGGDAEPELEPGGETESGEEEERKVTVRLGFYLEQWRERSKVRRRGRREGGGRETNLLTI